MRRGLALVFLLCLTACAQMVTTEPARLVPVGAADAPTVIAVRDQVDIRLETRFSRTLLAGSRWRKVGRIAQGDVYRPVDGVFSIEGRQVHEAYLVISGSSLRGFYLPGEANFSPLVPPLTINLGDPS
jgi:hypothetical protein